MNDIEVLLAEKRNTCIESAQKTCRYLQAKSEAKRQGASDTGLFSRLRSLFRERRSSK